MTIDIEKLPLVAYNYKLGKYAIWGGLLGKGGVHTIDIPIQSGALYLKPEAENGEIFLATIRTGMTTKGDMTISARMSYGDLVVYENQALHIPKGEERNIIIQVNQKLDETIPLIYEYRVVSDELDRHLNSQAILQQPESNKAYKAYSTAPVCLKGDPDYGVIVDKDTGKLYQGLWYKQSKSYQP